MQVTTTGFTIAEYCEQMVSNSIIVNREYQRTSKVWPPAARSYLIDTILHGYPMPKISLYQKTDLKSRRTIKEIVDGQQRSQAILDFYDNNLRISGRSDFSGKKYQDLDEPEQQRFMGYSLSADVFVSANDDEIRQTFRRINSYTVPLNPEEQRHATHQGAFKWFIVEVTETYAPTLKMLGVFTERNLSRMQDAKLFTEIVLAYSQAIQTFSKARLDKFYDEHEPEFRDADRVRRKLDGAFSRIIPWDAIHKGTLMKPFNFYSLVLALFHMTGPVQPLQTRYAPRSPKFGSEDVILSNLGTLANALEQESPPEKLQEFVDACSEATNTKKQRERRFKWFCKALGTRSLL